MSFFRQLAGMAFLMSASENGGASEIPFPVCTTEEFQTLTVRPWKCNPVCTGTALAADLALVLCMLCLIKWVEDNKYLRWSSIHTKNGSHQTWSRGVMTPSLLQCEHRLVRYSFPLTYVCSYLFSAARLVYSSSRQTTANTTNAYRYSNSDAGILLEN